jgi:ubiquinol-cytochrome c reductase cytochrome b subunit
VLTRRLIRWFDTRLGTSRFARSSLDKVFPDHWSFMLGEVALYCFVILVLTGVYLCFFFVPSATDVVYHGSYHALRGTHMSEAYRSVVQLSFDVRAGLVMRQIHHWAALLFVIAIVAHLCRIFFTGAFRRPRELNWVVGVTLLILAVFNGFAGYSLPDDLLSGTGLRIAYSIALSVPIVGTWIAFLVFGGEFPAHDIIPRLFVIHVLLIPGAIAALLTVHLAVLWRQKHTQFRGIGRREDNVVGSRLWPAYAAKSLGLFAVVAAIVSFLGGLVQINPVWLYGPFKAPAVSTAAQPDYYLGWVEGALRIMPPSLLQLGPYSISEVFWPGVLLPTFTFLMLYLWPFLEARVTHDHAEHHLLDRPSEHPVRTALGVTALAFYAVLLLAGAQDISADRFSLSLESVIWTFRVLVFVVPVLSGLLAWKLCHDLQRAHHAARLEAEAEPPIAQNELPVAPAPSPVVMVEPRRRWWQRMADVVLGVVLLVVLRRRRGHEVTRRGDTSPRSKESVR